MHEERKSSRREILTGLGGAAVSMPVIAACGKQSSRPAQLLLTDNQLLFTDEQLFDAASYVGEKLLGGAIGYAGGLILSKALGEVTLLDVKKWIDGAVAELERFISDELRRKFYEQAEQNMTADLRMVEESLGQYASLTAGQSGSKYLLENSDTSSARLVPYSAQFDQAIFITSAAMAYRLLTLYSLYKLDHDSGRLAHEQNLVESTINSIWHSTERLLAALEPNRHLSSECRAQSGNTIFCWNSDDGDKFGGFYTSPEKDGKGYQELANTRLRKQFDERAALYEKKRSALQQASYDSRADIWRAYSTMCASAGLLVTRSETEPPAWPQGVARATSARPGHWPLEMPGAIVRG